MDGKSRSSMLSPQAIEADLVRRRDVAAAQLAESAGSLEDKKGAQEDDKSSEKPAEETIVGSVHGDIPLNQFKARYADIFDQVREGQNLINGTVSYVVKIGKMEFKLRSLRIIERQALALRPVDEDKAQVADAIAQRIDMLSLSLVSVNGALQPLISVDRNDVSKWRTTDAAKAVKNKLEQYDESLITYLVMIHMDMDTAKFYALKELTENP